MCKIGAIISNKTLPNVDLLVKLLMSCNTQNKPDGASITYGNEITGLKCTKYVPINPPPTILTVTGIKCEQDIVKHTVPGVKVEDGEGYEDIIYGHPIPNDKDIYVVHERITTRGVNNADNTHPIFCSNVVLWHNGTLITKLPKNISDTTLIAEAIASDEHIPLLMKNSLGVLLWMDTSSDSDCFYLYKDYTKEIYALEIQTFNGEYVGCVLSSNVEAITHIDNLLTSFSTGLYCFQYPLSNNTIYKISKNKIKPIVTIKKMVNIVPSTDSLPASMNKTYKNAYGVSYQKGRFFYEGVPISTDTFKHKFEYWTRDGKPVEVISDTKGYISGTGVSIDFAETVDLEDCLQLYFLRGILFNSKEQFNTFIHTVPEHKWNVPTSYLMYTTLPLWTNTFENGDGKIINLPLEGSLLVPLVNVTIKIKNGKIKSVSELKVEVPA